MVKKVMQHAADTSMPQLPAVDASSGLCIRKCPATRMQGAAVVLMDKTQARLPSKTAADHAGFARRGKQSRNGPARKHAWHVSLTRALQWTYGARVAAVTCMRSARRPQPCMPQKRYYGEVAAPQPSECGSHLAINLAHMRADRSMHLRLLRGVHHTHPSPCRARSSSDTPAFERVTGLGPHTGITI